jgi:putative transposase
MYLKREVQEAMGRHVEHRNNAYFNRRTEQDHRYIKQRYYPMLSFGTFSSARHFCGAFELARQDFRSCRCRKQCVSLARQNSCLAPE